MTLLKISENLAHGDFAGFACFLRFQKFWVIENPGACRGRLIAFVEFCFRVLMLRRGHAIRSAGSFGLFL